MEYIDIRDLLTPERVKRRILGVLLKAEAFAGGQEFREMVGQRMQFFESTDGFDGLPIRIAVVRNPLNRIVHIYDTLRNGQEQSWLATIPEEVSRDLVTIAKSSTLEEFVSSEEPSVCMVLDNAQTRNLFDLPSSGEIARMEYSEVKARLSESFDHIAAYEYMPLALQLFEMQTGGWLAPEGGDISDSSAFMDEYVVDDTVRDILIRRNAADWQIWEASTELFLFGLDVHQKSLIEADYLARREAEVANKR